MPALEIVDLDAREILDSRGRPTLRVTAATGTLRAAASVPSGASTGRNEAHELRDDDPDRYDGAGVRLAAASVTGELRDLARSQPWSSLADLDRAMVDLDATVGRYRLGANAILGVSMAVSRLFAQQEKQPLWASLRLPGRAARLPVPHFNVLNGGAHADTGLAFQEFMVAPLGAPSTVEAVRAGADVYRHLRKLLAEGGHSVGLGDEGGFAPRLAQPEEALTLLVQAIKNAGYPLGDDGIALALDPAASQFRGEDGSYRIGDARLSSAELVERYCEIVRGFPVWSIEDGMAEDDDAGWRELTDRLGERVQLVGDDNFVTNAKLIRRAAARGIANAALVKPNQVGTVTETLDAIQACRDHGYTWMVSHRSGETGDDFIADLAVGTGAGQIKAGAPARGERVAKYNRLMDIETGHPGLPYGARPGSTR
ncbi:phosphopyruvate hydratase [Amycolatopsis sp. A1MSW2902]|uniref:phosphopyruvate hydratase n=1 Tax=Amycolatopsis sp. A1MSW2902 TaxID=687413 RepID=UPI00307DB16D